MNEDNRPYVIAMALRAALKAQGFQVSPLRRPEVQGDRMELLVESPERTVRVTVQVTGDDVGSQR